MTGIDHGLTEEISNSYFFSYGQNATRGHLNQEGYIPLDLIIEIVFFVRKRNNNRGYVKISCELAHLFYIFAVTLILFNSDTIHGTEVEQSRYFFFNPPLLLVFRQTASPYPSLGMFCFGKEEKNGP